MATSLQEHSEFLLGRTSAYRKSGAAPSDLETVELFEAIALALLTHPRVVPYISLQARNGLVTAINTEIESLDALKKTVRDLGNASYSMKDSSHLKGARTALLQIESLARPSTGNPVVKRFAASVDKFLNHVAAKNVRQGTEGLSRTSAEAKSSLPSDFSALQTAHAGTLERLYALAVSAQNFAGLPLASFVGVSTAVRARQDIEDVIRLLESGNAESNACDIVTRLIADKTALASLGKTPDPFEPLVDTAAKVPHGRVIRGESEAASALLVGNPGPFQLDEATVSLEMPGVSVGPLPLLQDLAGRPFVVSSGCSLPLVVGDHDSYLFITYVNGSSETTKRVTFQAGTQYDLASVRSLIDTALLGIGESLELDGRLVIAVSADSVRISDCSSEAHGSSATPSVYNSSSHNALGLSPGAVNSGEVSTDVVVRALNTLLGTYLNFAEAVDGRITATTLATSPGTRVTVEAPSALGLGSASAVSSRVFLKEGLTAVDPTSLLEAGDTLLVSGNSYRVARVDSSGILLESAIPTFAGDVVVKSAQASAWQVLDESLQVSLDLWLQRPFATDLTKVDRALSGLLGSYTPARRNDALRVLDELRGYLEELLASVTSAETIPPAGHGVREKEVLTGIRTALVDRKLDKAVDCLMRGQLLELFEMSSDTASYAGALLHAISGVARSNLRFPNTSLDEGLDTRIGEG